MIQWEIRDKEEYDRQMAQRTTVKPPKSGGDRNPDGSGKGKSYMYLTTLANPK